MSERTVHFEHDGHRFEAHERRATSAESGSAHTGEERWHWVVAMDGQEQLEFHGAYPYRDEEVRHRILEWYGIQKPRPAD